MKKTTLTILSTIAIFLVAAISIFIFFWEDFGPGIPDYSYKINDKCTLYKTSVHDISIECDGIEKGIEPKVVEIGWDTNYVLAITNPVTKRKYPENPNNTYTEPDESIKYWWILDVLNNINYGPIESETRFNLEIEKLNIKNIHLGTLKDKDI